MDFKKWVKSIQTVGYNGACMISDFIIILCLKKVKHYCKSRYCTVFGVEEAGGLYRVRFASFFSGGFITAIVVNSPEKSWQNAPLWTVRHRLFRYEVNFLQV